MKKLIALLLTVCMLLVCVFACAETASETAELEAADATAAAKEAADEAAADDVAEGEEAVTDDVSEDEETAALEAEDEAAEAEEVEAADPAEVALNNDRKIVSDINVTTYTEDLAGINGLSIKLAAQNNGLNAFTYEIAQDGEALFNGSIVYNCDEEKLYVTMDLLGDQTYCLDMHDLVELLDSMSLFADDAPDMNLEQLMNMLGLSDLSMSSLASLDLTNLDLTPMLSALVDLNKCVSITDVADFALNTEAEASEEETAEETTEEETAEAAEPVDTETENVEDADSATPGDIAMLMNIVVSRDDMSVLINAIAATIEANAEKLAPLGLDAESFTAEANAIADTFSEDIASVVGFSADGDIVYVCTDYSMEDVGAYRIQYVKELSEEGTKHSVNIMTTGDESEEFVTIFTGEAYVTDSTLHVRLLQGDEADSASGVQFTVILPSGDTMEYEFDIDTISVVDGVTSYPFSVGAHTTLTVNDVDFTADGTISVSANDDADKILDATVQIKTEPADTFDLSNAVDVGELDAGEDTDIFSAMSDTDNSITE